MNTLAIDHQILASLATLRSHSGKSLSKDLLSQCLGNTKPSLIEEVEGKFEPAQGLVSLLDAVNVRSVKKLATLNDWDNSYLMMELNRTLLAGKDFPKLTLSLRTIKKEQASLFSGEQLADVTPTVVARCGDELWQVEEIGVVDGELVHVEAIILSSPFNTVANGKGWLIHESRQTL